MVFQRENELEQAAIPFLHENVRRYSWQVPLQNRLIDLAAINNEGHLISIEFKLSKWKRAIEQAKANFNAFDYTYICVPGGNYVHRLNESARKLGIGVLIYDDVNSTVKIELNAVKNTRIWKPNFDNIKAFIEERGIIGRT